MRTLRSRRTIARLTTLVAGAVLPILAVAGPALASVHPDDGEQPASNLSAGMTILIYVVIPLGAFLTIAFFAVLPSTLSRPRYRPGRPWEHPAQWFGGPADVDAADPPSAVTDGSPRGGASAEW